MRRILPLLTVAWFLLAGPLSAQRPAYSPEQLSLIRNISESRISPDGKSVAFVTDITGAMELWTVPAGGGWPTQLTNLSEAVSDVRWSPDSKWLLFTSDYSGNERRDLYRVPADGGEVEKLTDTKISETSPRFSPDGKRIAFVADPDPDREFLFQLMVMDLQTRKVKQLTKEPVNVLSPVWSPDGKTIAVTRTGDDQKGEMLLVHAETGKKVEVPPPTKEGIIWPESFSPDGKSLLVLARNERGFMQMAVFKLKAESDPGKPPAATKAENFFLGSSDWDVIEVHQHDDGVYYVLNESGQQRLYNWRRFRSSPINLPGSARQSRSIARASSWASWSNRSPGRRMSGCSIRSNLRIPIRRGFRPSSSPSRRRRPALPPARSSHSSQLPQP